MMRTGFTRMAIHAPSPPVRRYQGLMVHHIPHPNILKPRNGPRGPGAYDLPVKRKARFELPTVVGMDLI
ncbi:protein of unknown function [Acidithiobacillus ferrivorans]|uniref:Uncharacterized protein n=1 Tax=Acidithiobacillus ferrivorans TaxID=160808 RepID=A0A060UML3_9PROT|nr:hypothetical protein AFERRI_360003 [Acidithiobacillus ferrivorans]SMH66550.1 protein of unknown function [Acidithiobacillus ferrivorans]